VAVSDLDANLVRLCLTGDPAAIRSLIERFQSDVFGLSMRMLANRHDAEDVTQDVFLRAFRSLKSYDAARPLKPWMMTICVNQCRTAIAKRKSKPRPGPIIEDVPERRPVNSDGNELADAVRDAVDRLRDDYKIVFVMFHEQGLAYDEISATIDRPVGTVKTWLHRSRAMIMDHLQRLGLMTDEVMYETE
jgi:RNA polymerase sigma factor (sigma-70 family)